MKKILLFIFILAVSINAKATHLMGGEITWECIKTGPDAGKYIFNVKVYRDCQGIAIDTNMSLDAHNVPGISTITLMYLGANDISPSCNTINGPNNPFSCNGLNQAMSTFDQGAVEEHLYQSAPIEINGTPDANGWHFTWSSCCRNNAVTNIMNPGSYGFTLRAVMYSYTDSLGNVFPNGGACYDSSPKFYEKPRTILEVGNGYDPFAFSNGFTYSHNAFDEEQDSIAYTWGEPLNDLGYDYLNPNSTAVPFMSPSYTYTMPINGIVLNPITGRTYYPANQQGNYVTCTNASAYKCGQLVAEIFREVQIVLVPPTCNLGDTTNGNFGADTLCNVRPVVQPPFFYPGTAAPFQWDTVVHCGDTVAFDFIANDNDYYPNGSRQDLKFEVSGGQFYNYNAGVPCQNPPCATFEETSTGATPPFITSGGTGEGYFEWITSCNHVINSCSGGLQPSIYTFVIKVQDDFCPAPAIENTSQVISITVYPPCGNIKANAVLTQASCGLSDGTASITPSGGFAPYTSYWFDMNGLPVNPNALAAGDYQLRITDVSLCEMIDTITITSPQIFSTTITGSSPSCFGSNDGSATVSSTSGGSVSYLWSNGASTQTINNLSSGQYSIIVTDGNNCSVYDTIILSQPLALSSNISITSAISCYGGSDGSLSVQINNGVSPINYLWSNGSSTQTINNLSVGQYNVTVTDSNNCSLTDNITLNQPSELINDSSTTLVSNVSCFGGNTGSIDISPNGGTPPYYFNWSNGASTEDISNLSSGNYSVIITDSAGCSSISYSYTITTPTQIQNFSVITPVSCNGGNNGSIDISVSGGIPPYSFIWSNGTTTEDITGVSSGVYVVEVTDNSGCIFIDSMNITQPPLLSSSLTSITGGLSGTATGGTSPYTYEFYGPSGLIATSINNMGTSVVINPNISGLYTLIVTDLNNCIDSVSTYFNSTTGLDNTIEKSIRIYPNPTNGILNVSFNNNGITLLKLTNILGENVTELEINKTGYISTVLDITKHASGVYFIQMKNKNERLNYKVVLE